MKKINKNQMEDKLGRKEITGKYLSPVINILFYTFPKMRKIKKFEMKKRTVSYKFTY